MKSIKLRKVSLFLFSTIAVLWTGLFSARAAAVYVLSSGNGPTDTAVMNALTQGGHSATLGVEYSLLEGPLDGYDVVLYLNNFNYGRATPSLGLFSLVQHLCDGGGIVTGEWFNYDHGRTGVHDFLWTLSPAEEVQWNSAAETAYTQATPDPILNEGLPKQFFFPLGNISGSESSFGAKPGATTFYLSSNGGGRPDSPAVVGWTRLNGKVLSISTLITATELGSIAYQTFFANAVRWAAPQP